MTLLLHSRDLRRHRPGDHRGDAGAVRTEPRPPTPIPPPRPVSEADRRRPEAPDPAADRRRRAGAGHLHPPRSTASGIAQIVARAKAYITEGDVFQVVPSHRFRSPYSRDPFALYRSLRRTNPSPFLFYLNFGGFQLAGSSPEILVRLRDGKITIRPLAGTRRRGATPAEDLALEAELIADPKERAEHLMLLDLGRNDVGRVAMLKDQGFQRTGPALRVAAPRAGHRQFLRRTLQPRHAFGLQRRGRRARGPGPRRRGHGRPARRHPVRRACWSGPCKSSTKLEIEKRGTGYAGGGRLFRLRRLGGYLHRAQDGALQRRDHVRPGRRRRGGRQRRRRGI